MSGRRRGTRNSLVVIYWRDIPAQVTADGQKTLLHPRFQHAIDRAAVIADKTDTSSYVAEWRRVATPLPRDDHRSPAEIATAIAAELDLAYGRDRLEALVAAGGTERDAAGPTPTPEPRSAASPAPTSKGSPT